MKSLKNLALITLGTLTIISSTLLYLSNKNHNSDNAKNTELIKNIRKEKTEEIRKNSKLFDETIKLNYNYAMLATEYNSYRLKSQEDRTNLNILEEEYFNLNKDYRDILKTNLELIGENTSLIIEKGFYKNLVSKMDSMLLDCQQVYDTLPVKRDIAEKFK
jgi:hypothetical protein